MSEKNSNEDERLEQFTQRFSAAIPELSDEAIGRIEQSMGCEIRRVTRLRYVQTFVAAAAVLAILLTGILLMQGRGGPKPDVAEVEQPERPGIVENVIASETPVPAGVPVAVEDRMIVAVAVSSPREEEGESLVPLEDYQSLIGDWN
jgi:hypothetical protein